MKRFIFTWLCCTNGTEFIEHRLHSGLYDDPHNEIVDNFLESCFPGEPDRLPFDDIEYDGVLYHLQRVEMITEMEYNVLRKYLMEGF
jgi:hypothetical protein